MRKAIIYMEVACGCCGGIINRDYHYRYEKRRENTSYKMVYR